jgi:hypothetical protein
MKKGVESFLISILIILGVVENLSGAVEDSLTMKAIYYDEIENRQDVALNFWKKLFDMTNGNEYLIRYFHSSLWARPFKEVVNEANSIIKDNQYLLYSRDFRNMFLRLYALKYMQNNDIDDIKGLIKLFENSKNLDATEKLNLGKLYSLAGDGEKALRIYYNLYKKYQDWDSLSGILPLIDEEYSRSILWGELLNNKNLPAEAFQLFVDKYLKEDDSASKYIFLYKSLYEKTGDKKYINILVSILLSQNYKKELIKFLESMEIDDKNLNRLLLYELYIINGEFNKAIELANESYKKSKDPNVFGDSAFLMFEIMLNSSKIEKKEIDKATLDKILKLFEKSFALGSKDDGYYNYYGYILINYNIDVKKGIEYVKKALKIAPKQPYYLDLLAWGYYKLGECSKAKEIAREIESSSVKVMEEEIIFHLEKIKECQESK